MERSSPRIFLRGRGVYAQAIPEFRTSVTQSHKQRLKTKVMTDTNLLVIKISILSPYTLCGSFFLKNFLLKKSVLTPYKKLGKKLQYLWYPGYLFSPSPTLNPAPRSLAQAYHPFDYDRCCCFDRKLQMQVLLLY